MTQNTGKADRRMIEHYAGKIANGEELTDRQYASYAQATENVRASAAADEIERLAREADERQS